MYARQHQPRRAGKRSLIGTDDDRATASATFDVRFTNIQPHSINIQLVDGNGPVIMDAQNTWHVDEDQDVSVRG